MDFDFGGGHLFYGHSISFSPINENLFGSHNCAGILKMEENVHFEDAYVYFKVLLDVKLQRSCFLTTKKNRRPYRVSAYSVCMKWTSTFISGNNDVDQLVF